MGNKRMNNKRRKYKNYKERVTVYALRVGTAALLTFMMVLMVFGAVYIYKLSFPHKVSAEEEEKVSVLVDNGEQNRYLYGNVQGEEMIEDTEFTYLSNQKKSTYDKLIVLDPGHGGSDVGAEIGNIYEKNITLKVALKMKKKLEQQGIGVILTREGDDTLTLEDRAWIANRDHADLFFSVHCNYFDKDTSIRGLECYYQEGSDAGMELAQNIIEGVEYAGNIQVRNAKPEDFSVLRNTAMPAVLIELGYMTNKEERKLLLDEDYQDILAEDLVSCIMDSLN